MDTTGSSSSHRIKETESTRKAFMTIQSSQHSTKVTPALSAFFPLKKSTTTTDRIKDFAKREHSHIDLNHKLREIELASYREELVTQRRLLLFLAYAMTSVITAVALWVVCFVALSHEVNGFSRNLVGRVMSCQSTCDCLTVAWTHDICLCRISSSQSGLTSLHNTTGSSQPPSQWLSIFSQCLRSESFSFGLVLKLRS